MERISNIVVTGNLVSAVFATNDEAEANLLRRSIMSEIETYAIDVVIFDVNTSSRHDEIIAMRLGQCVIDNMAFVPPGDGEPDVRVHIDVMGPSVFTTDGIPGIPFTYKTDIAVLRSGERIQCDAIIKKGQGLTHVKWRPVAGVTISPTDGGYLIKFKTIGMLAPETIFQRALAAVPEAAKRGSVNLFFHTLVPATYTGDDN